MSVTDVDGIRVGHWTDVRGATGCTVVLVPEGAVGSGHIAGGAPATRDFALLAPERLVERIDAVVLSGGSAFGLAAADGVMGWLEARGVGFPTAGGPVPIVVGMSLFDLTVGEGRVRPGASEGYAACVAATPGPVAHGRVGAGTGATVDKWGGRDEARPGGLVGSTARSGDVVVAALLAVNAVGTPGTFADHDLARPPHPGFGNTTIGVLVTNARLSKLDCHRLSMGGHDGMARALTPPHTRYDGDALVAVATGAVDAHPEQIRALGVFAVEQAIGTLAQ